MARCDECNFYEKGHGLKRCRHPYMESDIFGLDMPAEIDCDCFECAAYAYESVIDLVVHEDIEMFIYGGR